MQAVILIGGLGTRLYPLTYSTPKSLLPIANIVFIDRVLRWFEEHNVDKIVLAMSHLSAPIVEYLEANHPNGGVHISIRIEEKPLGSGGALRNCEDLLEDEFILLNGDIFTDLDLNELVDFHRGAGASITATLCEVDDPTHYGIADLDSSGRVLDWQEKPSPSEAKSRWGNVGAWVVQRKVIEYIPREQFVSLEKDIFPILFASQELFYGYRFYGYWKDIGTVERYVQANRDVLHGRVSTNIDKDVRARGQVIIADTAVVEEGAVLIPPILVGDSCTIGARAQIIGPTIIDSACRIGAGSTIRSSIIWRGSEIGEKVTITDAIVAGAKIGHEAVISSGSVVSANSMLSEGTRLKPGTLLGPGSWLP